MTGIEKWPDFAIQEEKSRGISESCFVPLNRPLQVALETPAPGPRLGHFREAGDLTWVSSRGPGIVVSNIWGQGFI